MNADKDTNDFITTRQAAEMLGVSLRTAQLWVENEILSAWKTAGGHRRISRRSVEELLDRQREALESTDKPTHLTVLVVEDVDYMRKLYRKTFDLWGLPVNLVTATNGFEGLYQLGCCKPDLLITDLSMPGMDGFKMIWALVEDEAIAEEDIVVVTGITESRIEQGGGLPNKIRLFFKPVPFDALKSIVEQKITSICRAKKQA